MDGMIERKLTTATIMGTDENDLVPNNNGSIRWLYRIAGRANGSIKGESQYGSWVALVGDFASLNFDTGEQLQAPKCFLPLGMAETIAAKITDDVSIDFVYDIGIEPGKKRAGKVTQKYEYVIRNAVKQEKNVLELLQAKNPNLLPVPTKVKQLPAS